RDKLGGDSQAVWSAANTALDHVLNREFSRDLVYPLIAVLVSHHRSAGDHAQLFGMQSTKLRNQLFRQAVSEVLLFRITGEIFQGQHGKHDFSRRQWRTRMQ